MNWKLLPVKEFNNWSEQWQSLNKTIANNLPIMHPIFVAALIDSFANGDELLAIAEEQDNVIAMGIFYKKTLYSWQSFQPSQAPVGLWLCPNERLSESLRSLTKALPGFTLRLDILQQDPDISSLAQQATAHIEQSDYIFTSKLAVDQDFDSYFSALGKNQRQNYNKANNRLNKQDVKVRLEIEESPEQMYQSVAQYGNIESNSWKDALGTSVNIDNQQGVFFQRILSEFAKKNNAQVWKYFYDDTLVAIDLCIKNNEQLIILKTTFDSEYSRYSPAINMKLDALKPIFDNRLVQRVEFFGKTLQWHTRLNSIGRTMYHFSFYRYPILLKLKTILTQLIKK